MRPSTSPIAALLLVVAIGAVSLAQAADDAWLHHPVTDAVTGETFTVRGLEGSVVVVETMATWCSNCRRQLGHAAAAAATLAAEHPGVPVVFLAISVERGLAPEALAAYAERNAFAFRWVVADDDLLRMLADRFGRVALNPPSTPHWVVDAMGGVGELTTGLTPPEAIVARVLAAR